MGILMEISTKRHWGYDQKYSSLLRIMSSLSLSGPHAISQLVTWESDDSTLLQEIFYALCHGDLFLCEYCSRPFIF